MAVLAQLSTVLTTLIGQLLVLVLMGWLATRFMSRQGNLPGQVPAIAVLKDTVDALTAQLDLTKAELAQVRATLAEEQQKCAALATQLVTAERAVGQAAAAFFATRGAAPPGGASV